MKNYICDVSILNNFINTKNQQLLSIERKIISLKEELFDMENIFIISFSRKEFDKLNYIYTFYLYKLKLDFDMDLFQKYFYLGIKDKNSLEQKIKNKTYKDFNAEFKKEGISDNMFENINTFNEFYEYMINLINDDKQEDLYKIAELLLMYVINLKTEQINFYTGKKEEEVKILKKKSTEKIDKTLGNKFLHLTLYGKDYINI